MAKAKGKTTRTRSGEPTLTSSAWARLRRQAIEELAPVCSLCGGEIDLELPGRHPWGVHVHHLNHRMLGGSVIVPIEELALAHNRCNAEDGSRMRARAAGRSRLEQLRERDGQMRLGDSFRESRSTRLPLSVPLSTHQDGLWSGSAELMYRTVRSTEGLDGWVEPRLATRAQPDVSGTYGQLADAWIEAELGIELLPWQRHVLDRALEHREDGSLRWSRLWLSVPRQQGKSWLTRAVMIWRMVVGAEVFAEPQLTMHIGSDRRVARDVWRGIAGVIEERIPDAVVRFANGTEGIYLPNGSEYMVAAPNMGVVGRSVSMAFVDEIAYLPNAEEVIENGLIPTMLARASPQLWMVGTAGDSTSELARTYRSRAILELESESANTLMLEWSADPAADLTDPGVWRAASPHWTPQREHMLTELAATMSREAFAMQLCNVWVTGSSRAWVTSAAWVELESDEPLPDGSLLPGTIAIERATDDGRSMAPFGIVLAVRRDDGVVMTRAWVENTERDAFARLQELADSRQGVEILHHEAVRIPHIRGAAITALRGNGAQLAGYPFVRGAIMDGMLLHDGSSQFTEHVLMANTYTNPEGRVMLSVRQSEGQITLAKALVWAAGHELRPETRARPMLATG